MLTVTVYGVLHKVAQTTSPNSPQEDLLLLASLIPSTHDHVLSSNNLQFLWESQIEADPPHRARPPILAPGFTADK